MASYKSNPPTNRDTFVEYCLRRLGKPVIDINVDPDQINDRVDDAIQFYQTFHSDAMNKSYRRYQVTQADMDRRWISLPDYMLYVSRVWPLTTNSSNSSGMWSARYQMQLNDIYDLQQSGSLVNYTMTREFLEMLDLLLNGVPPVRFSRHMQRLFIDVEWSESLMVGDWMIIEGYMTLNPDDWPSVYNDMYLKKYATALIKKQWGDNLKKFANIQMPGGVTLNGQVIFDEAVEEIKAAEEECRNVWETPPEFFVG